MTAIQIVHDLTGYGEPDEVATDICAGRNPAYLVSQLWRVDLSDRIPSMRIRTLRRIGEVSAKVAEILAVRELDSEIE